MNIFYLDENPAVCAKLHCDKHVIKMVLEYAQILSTSHRLLNGDEFFILKDETLENKLYRPTHIKHPAVLWVMESTLHYEFLYNLFEETAKEYNFRYGKHHKSYTDLKDFLKNAPKNLKDNGFREPPKCMPPEFYKETSVLSYQEFYRNGKAKRFALTFKNRETPDFLK